MAKKKAPSKKRRKTEPTATPLTSVNIHCAHTDLVAVEALTPHPRNPNRHPESQIRLLAKIIAHQGWRNPIVVSARSGFVIKGHARLAAAKLNGWETVPVDRQSYATEADEWADMVADNRIAELAEPDNAGILELMGDLGDDFDRELMGYDVESFATLSSSADADLLAAAISDDNGDDAIPDNVSRRTQAGDIWQLGDHRLACGDSSLPETINRLMAGAYADLCFTSPPYDRQRDYTQKITDWQELMRNVFAILPASEMTQVLVNLGLIHRNCEWQPYWDPWIEWMRSQGWRRFGFYAWDRGPGYPTNNGRPNMSLEFIFHFNKQIRATNKVTPTLAPGRKQQNRSWRNPDGSQGPPWNTVTGDHKSPDDVFRIYRERTKDGGGHPAVFPVALAATIQATFGHAGDIVYEPFCGAGTSIIASEKLGRRCYASEIEPKYCDIAIARWEKLTGKDAIRIAT